MCGSYMFGDLTGVMFSGFENPPESGKYVVTDLPFQCTPNTPVPCETNSSLGGIISYGEDMKGDIYVLGVNGAYRMVSPSLCNITCTATFSAPAPAPTPALPPPPLSDATSIFVIVRNSAFCLILALCALVWL
jgi:hypothetical protein